MGMLEELNTLLERIPVWRQLVALPDRVATLEARLTAVEAQLAGKTGALCPMCNAPGWKRAATKPHPVFGDTGLMIDSYACSACGHAEEQTRDTLKR